MVLTMLALTAHAGPDADVARGWYLWRTGQDEAAAEVAATAVEEHPGHLGAHRLHVAMQVVVGNGASVEAQYREWWGLDPSDPIRRVALAFAIGQRHADGGSWCDEVEALLASVPVTVPPAEGERPSKKRPFTEEHYWSTVADRVRELRCEGTTDHADAELRRLAKDGGLGWADGVVAKMAAGYVKEDLPEDLERLWTEHPERLDSAALLWADSVSGPARARARSITSRALSDALEGDDPVPVHATLLAYRSMGKDGKVSDAVARLAEVDPQADPDLVLSLDDVRDPPVYDEIDGCMIVGSADSMLECLDGIEGIGDSGSVAAYRLSQRRVVLEIGHRDDEAFEVARAAWQAERDHRFNARTFARLAVPRPELSAEDAALAVDAMDVVLAGRVPDEGEVPEGQRKRLAADLELASLALLAADRAPEALDGQLLARELDPAPRRDLVLGRLLAAADQPDDAVLRLTQGLLGEQADTALITVCRGLLQDLDQGWHPRGLAGMLEEVGRGADQDAPRHPLVGKPFPLPDLLPAPPEPVDDGEEEAQPVVATVALLWTGWHAGDALAVERVAAIADRYAERGVAATAISVGLDEEALPDEVALDGVFGGAAAMRELRIVGLPAVVIVDASGRIAAVQVPYDRGGQSLEKTLDELLPEDDEE